MSRPAEADDAGASARWQQVQEVLADAIDCPVDERATLLDGRCAGDRALRDEVESLLLAHEGEGLVDRLRPLLKVPGARRRGAIAEWAGRTVAHYVVQDRIGAGGMAVVYRARDERLGRQVALKFLSPHLSADALATARFVAEARAAAALDHPNVCTIYDIGAAPDGALFFAMPLYDGETLQARLDRGRLSFGEALPLALQIARGLGHAHEAGIVHRDVKPSNIMLLTDGTVKILDFGIAQIQEASRTDPQPFAGTAAYMSPEHASAGPLDCRTDIWSLGIVVHEMLAGRRPFEGDDMAAVMKAILTQEPRLTASSYPDVPAGIDRVLARTLAKAPDQRYASMSGLAAELSLLTAPAAADRAAGAAGTPEQMSTAERRRAAVLVTVVSDYPSLVDRLTPREAQQLIARVRDVAVDVVREYGGLVNQAIGDEIVSIFGVPAAHEDDDLRAVLAALELHGRVCLLAAADFPPGLPLRIQSGLHVGAVVTRRLHEGPRRYDIVGAPAAVASRLAVLANPGDVWVSPETQRLVAPYVHTSACSPVALDSHTGQVTPFRLHGATGVATRLEASSRTGLTPYVGRQLELSALQAHVTRAAGGAGSVVAVVGEAGVGKSRLLHELQETLDTSTAGAQVFRARCRAYGDGVPYGVFVQILCAALDLRTSLPGPDDVAVRIRAVDAALEPFVPLFLHLLSLSSDAYNLPRHLRGEHLQAALLDALAALVEVLSRRGPLLILVEDWHWADTGSRAALLRIAELADSTPLVLVVTTREGGTTDGWPAHATWLRLRRLDFEASVAIMSAVLGARQVSDVLAQRMYERAGGNPFFLEQMCAALLERHALTVREGNARVEGDESALVLPDTVQAVIRARLDNLPAEALEVVRVASVIGPEFDHALLAEVVPAPVDLRPAIASLQAAGLIRQTPAAAAIRYQFTHALTQAVCYDSLVGHQRTTLHGAIGRALAFTHANRPDEPAALLAHHFSRAEDWPGAIHFGRRAAERAIALSQFSDALVVLDQALEWVGRLRQPAFDLTADLLLQQERVCETLGLRTRQRQIIDSLITHLARDGSSRRLAEAYLRQGDLSTLLRQFAAADRALATALRIAQEHGDTTLLRSGLRSLGLLRWHEGRHADALEITRRVLALDRECEDDLAVASALINLGTILRTTGDYQQARATLEEALTMGALHRDPKKLLYTQHLLATLHRAVGDLDRALDYLVRNDDIARIHLLPIQRSFHLTSIAHIQLQQGSIEAALKTYRSAVDLSRRARHAEGLVQALRMLGNALLGLARYDEARPCLAEAADLFAQLEDGASEAEMRAGLARVLERTSPDGALQAWRAVLALQRTRGDVRSELDAREGLARATRANGPEEAIPAFESALALAATIGQRTRETVIRNTLGLLQWQRRDYAAALGHYEVALRLVRDQGNRQQEATILNGVGACLAKLGRPDEARTVLEESLALSRAIGARELEADAAAALGHVSRSVHHLDGAARYFEQSRVVRHAIGDRRGEGWMHLRLAEVRHGTGDTVGALAAVASAAAAAAETGDDALSTACHEAARRSDRQRSGEVKDAPLHHRAVRCGSHP